VACFFCHLKMSLERSVASAFSQGFQEFPWDVLEGKRGRVFFISFQWFASLSCESLRSKEEFDGRDCGALLSFKNVVRRLDLALIPPRRFDAS
jgi:hypothetical protein